MIEGFPGDSPCEAQGLRLSQLAQAGEALGFRFPNPKPTVLQGRDPKMRASARPTQICKSLHWHIDILLTLQLLKVSPQK